MQHMHDMTGTGLRRTGLRARLILSILTSLLIGVTRVVAQQPAWSATNALSTPRFDHTATLLTNGKVLVVGGLVRCMPACQATNTAELYDPATGAWSSAGTLPAALGTHAAVRLQNGKVLVISGFSPPNTLLRTAYLYDPDSGAWTPTGAPTIGRQYHTAVVLPNGKVLVTGGLALSGTRFAPTNVAELYDPATGMWSTTGAMNVARFYHALALLPNGKVLAAVGSPVVRTTAPNFQPVRSCELYDPATGVWSLTGEVALPRTTPTATLLPTGKVLLAGGTDNNTTENPTNTAEIYDPATGQWSATGPLNAGRDYMNATLLANGKVLLSGGYGAGYAALRSSDLYDPAAGTWSLTSEIGKLRFGHSATLLDNGKVLAAGGSDTVTNSQAFANAELYDSGAALLASVSAASFAGGVLAPDSIVAGFGANLSNRVETAAGFPLPTELAGVRVRVRDSAGTERPAPLFFAGPSQVNYQIPAGTALGMALITVNTLSNNVASGLVEIAGAAPGLFAANADGQGVAAAVALRVRADGSQSFEAVARLEGGKFVPAPIDLGPAGDQLFLVLFGTGIRAQRMSSARIGGADSEVLFAGAVAGLVGLDQVNVRVPRALAGRGEVDVALIVDGRAANTLRVQFR